MVAGSAEALGASVREIGRQVERFLDRAHNAVNEVDATSATARIIGEAWMAEDTGTGIHQVLCASSELAKPAEALRTRVQGFITEIRAT